MRKVFCNPGACLRLFLLRLFPGLAFLVLTIVFGACTSLSEKGASDDSGVFFDLDQLVSEQTKYLASIQPEVEKELRLNGKAERLVLGEVDWDDELALFRLADINKASYQDSYEVDRSTPQVEDYRLKPGHMLPVRRLKVHYNAGAATEVFAEMKVENKLFDSYKELTLRLDGNSAKNRLLSYELKGFQQWLLGEKTSFEVKGTIK